MCGLAGFARHPNAPKLELALLVFDELMGAIESRGRHATGIAVKTKSGEADFTWKRAVAVSAVRKSDAWGKLFTTMPKDVTSIIGHTRWSTHAHNTHLDDAAHPFTEGKITGAHNGIISNWRDVAAQFGRTDLIVDSQAAFVALNEVKDTAKALDLLDGYFALTWTKGASLFMTRTPDAPLAVAYLPALRTIFWTSERSTLSRVLTSAKLGDFEIWEPKPMTVYRYTPSAFTPDTTNVERKDAPFRGRSGNGRMVNSANPTVVVTSPSRATSTSTRTVSVDEWRARGWDATTGREIDLTSRLGPRSGGTSRTISLTDLSDRVDELEKLLRRSLDRIDDLEDVVAGLHNEYVDEVDDDTPHTGDDPCACPPVAHNESPEPSPYNEPTTTDDPTHDLFV